MKIIITSIVIFASAILICEGQDFVDTAIDSEVTQVQPMTGIVFWPKNKDITTDAISLEYSYMDFSEIVTAKSVYDWTLVDNLLDEMASRNHQAVLRFRYSYPGKTTTVPQYIKDLADYNETEGLSEGQTTWFPDWTNNELKRFTLEFYTKYAERYDSDPRLAFVQVGFGLWAEYHIYDGPREIGKTFPSKAFQTEFFNHLDNVFINTYWSVSIDAADATYSPIEAEPHLKEINFGVFDDSFMHQNHGGYNTSNWNFFGRDRYKVAPAGGEFSYYSDYDQRNVLNPDVGAYDVPYEIFAQNFHISYINGNDQSKYQTLARIKEASMNSGYKFKITSFKTKIDSSIVEVVNLGVAPIYVDAYVTVNDIRSVESLKLLAPDETKTFHISAGGTNSRVTITSDDILPTEKIQYFGTINNYQRYVQPTPLVGINEVSTSKLFAVYPNVIDSGKINILTQFEQSYSIELYNSRGALILNEKNNNSTTINVEKTPKGIYLLILRTFNNQIFTEKLIIK